MAQRPKTLAVCINRRFGGDIPSCAERGSEALADALEKGIAERRINARIERMTCFGYCQKGPNMRLVPGGGPFLHGVTADQIPAIFDQLEAQCGLCEESDKDASAAAYLVGQ